MKGKDCKHNKGAAPKGNPFAKGKEKPGSKKPGFMPFKSAKGK